MLFAINNIIRHLYTPFMWSKKMQANNDNGLDEDFLLLMKAKEMLGKCGIHDKSIRLLMPNGSPTIILNDNLIAGIAK